MKTKRHKYKNKFTKINGRTVYLNPITCVSCFDKCEGFITEFKHLLVIISVNPTNNEKHFWGIPDLGSEVEYNYCKDCCLKRLQYD